MGVVESEAEDDLILPLKGPAGSDRNGGALGGGEEIS